MAEAGTTARTCVCWPWNVAWTNMPRRIIPGFSTSMRTLAVRILGSRMAPILLMRPLRTHVRVSVQADVGVLADVHESQIVLVHVAEHPDVRQVGDGEGVGRCQALRAGGGSHLLVCDHTGDGRHNVDDRRGMILVRPEHAKMFDGGFHGDVGLLLGVLGHFQILLRDGALVVQNLRTRELRLAQSFSSATACR